MPRRSVATRANSGSGQTPARAPPWSWAAKSLYKSAAPSVITEQDRDVSASETPMSLAAAALCGSFSLTLAEWRGLRPGRLAEELERRLEAIRETAAGRPIANVLGLAV